MLFKNIFLILLLIVFTWSCQTEQKLETEEMQNVANESAAISVDALPQLSDDDYVKIYEAQELIKIYQEDKTYRQSYCKKAYLKDHKLFVSMGIGMLRHPTTGKPIPRNYAQRAALLDARRWSAYGETWLKNNYEPPFGKIEKYINQPIQTLNENIVGDSLFIFIATTMDLP